MSVSSKHQIEILVAILICLGLGAASYKYTVLGFPLLASEKETVWQLEGKVSFVADGGPVTLNVNLPDDNPRRKIVFSDLVASGFEYQEIYEQGVRLAQWRADHAVGPQVIYTRSESYFKEVEDQAIRPMASVSLPELTDTQSILLQELIAELDLERTSTSILTVLQLLNRVGDERLELLLRDFHSAEQRNRLAAHILFEAGYANRVVSGIYLEDKARSQSIHHFVEVQMDRESLLFDTREVIQIPWDRVILLREFGEPVIELFGGRDSEISYATTKVQRAAFTSAVNSAAHSSNPLIDFSIYSLPLSEQNTFKLLLVIPLGALVVVILRNLVGIRTSGTFMPVLIALTFLQTSLLTGLLLFIAVVGVGLVLRSYLSRLNLLLVPRIASVLVFVIIIYAAIGIMSSKMGWQAGLKVTFFPMVILSWTIERMSILWDEEGGREVMIQGGGSLLTASLAFLLMSNPYVADTIFLYPELLLVLLAIIISIGSYSGYRLSDLLRFSPMERH
ncbi:MAG: UUP1 family membrane protein [Cellvibrionaceae bacterium]